MKKTTATTTDCREEIGITVGLIDSIITQCRILSKRDLTSKEVKEAFKDLQDDEDLKFILLSNDRKVSSLASKHIKLQKKGKRITENEMLLITQSVNKIKKNSIKIKL